MTKSSISLKGSLDNEAFAGLLSDVTSSFKAGTVCLQKGSEYVTLKPAGGLEFELEAEVKKGKQKLSITVKWEEPTQQAAPGEIKISAVEPEFPIEPEAVPAGECAAAPAESAAIQEEPKAECEKTGKKQKKH